MLRCMFNGFGNCLIRAKVLTSQLTDIKLEYLRKYYNKLSKDKSWTRSWNARAVGNNKLEQTCSSKSLYRISVGHSIDLLVNFGYWIILPEPFFLGSNEATPFMVVSEVEKIKCNILKVQMSSSISNAVYSRKL
nr:hypothetical protein [Tanacetum cinerariifolium]